MAGALSGYNSSVGGYRPVTFEQFQGLDLKSAPDQSACVDMLNVDITLDGNLRTRDGTVVFSNSDTNASSPPGSLFAYNSLSSPQLILVARDVTLGGLRYYAVSSVGVLGAGFDSAGGLGQCSAAQIGTASGSFMYITNGSSSGIYPVRYDGATFTQPTVTVDGVGGKQGPFSKLLVASPIDNRLVTAGTLNGTSGPNAATSSTSHVWFSEPGLPESYLSTSFVQLTPGDGEQITAAVSWRELVFVFKQTKFFVFYGTSTDSTGKPIFNYRAVAGAGAEPSAGNIGPPYAVAGSDGVYFANSAGVFKTTGGAPVKISTPLDPIWQGGLSSFWQGGAVTGLGVNSLTWHNERLYVTLTTTVATLGNLMLVYDPRAGVDRWLVWQVGTAQTIYPVAFAPTVGGPKGLYFAHGKRVRVFSAAATDDAGTAIRSRYRSGFGFGGPDETTVRETILDGSGMPTLQWSRDWQSPLALPSGLAGGAVTLGTAPTIAVGRQRIAIRGRRFSWQIGSLTNEVTNPSGEGATVAPWTSALLHTTASTITLSGVPTPIPFGANAFLVNTTTSVSSGIEVALTANYYVAGTIWTFSFYARNDGGTNMACQMVLSGNGGADAQVQVVTFTPVWTRFSIAATLTALRSTLNPAVRTTLTTGQDFYVDGLMVTPGPVAPPYGDGTITGWQWDGTANASTSTQGAAWSLQRLQAQQRDLRESSVTV